MGMGEIIKLARKDLGMTQKELSDIVGCAEVTIRQYEANRREPAYDMCLKLEDALHIALVAHPVPEELLHVSSDPVEINTGGPLRIVLLDAYNKLNGEGQRIAVERIKELALIPKYQATPTENPAGIEAGAHEGEKMGDLSTKQEKPPEGENKPNDGNA